MPKIWFENVSEKNLEISRLWLAQKESFERKRIEWGHTE